MSVGINKGLSFAEGDISYIRSIYISLDFELGSG